MNEEEQLGNVDGNPRDPVHQTHLQEQLQTESLQQSLASWLDQPTSENPHADTPTDADRKRVIADLHSSPSLRQQLADLLTTWGFIKAIAVRRPRWLAVFDAIEESSPTKATGHAEFSDLTLRKIASYDIRPRRQRRLGVFAVIGFLVASIIVGASLFFMLRRGDTVGDRVNDSVDDIGNNSSVANPISSEPSAILSSSSDTNAAEPAVGFVLSTEGLDRIAEATFPSGGELSAGPYHWQRGRIAIHLLHGVTVTAQGPMRMELLRDGDVKVDYGRVRVRVPDGAEGFRLHSGQIKILDLGTEFAANFDRGGHGQMRVFEGSAEVTVVDSLGDTALKRRVGSNQAFQFTGERGFIRPIDLSGIHRAENGGEGNLSTTTNTFTPFTEMIATQRMRLRLPIGYAKRLKHLGVASYWTMQNSIAASPPELPRHVIPNERTGGRHIQVRGAATLVDEADGNRSVRISRDGEFGCLVEPNGIQDEFAGDFTIGLFVQPFRMHSGMIIAGRRWPGPNEGFSLVLQTYSPPRRLDRHGKTFPSNGLISRVSLPPRWDHQIDEFEDGGDHRLMPLQWSHVAMRRAGDRFSLWIDGHLISERRCERGTPDFKTIVIGSRNGNGKSTDWVNRVWIGCLDELAIFDRALDPAEMKQFAGR